MFNPKHRILLTNNNFYPDKVVCLGSQLILIIQFIKGLLPPHTWFGADVEAVGEGIQKLHLKDAQIKKIGSDLDFIQYCTEINQFIWGDFVCINNEFTHQEIQGIEIETEDRPFRSIPCVGILLEIRTFDTTFFGIYSEDEEILKKISTKFASAETKNSSPGPM